MSRSSQSRVESISRLARRTALLATVVSAVVLPTAAAQAQQPDAASKPSDVIEFTVDVAEDLTRAVPTLVRPDDTQPERGTFYVTEGRVFPGGTIEGDGADFNPGRSGHVGVWLSRGTHLVAAAEIPAAPLWAHTSQLFVLGRQGTEQIASEGVEGAGTLTRAVTGGAGNYVGFIGVQRSTFLGVNATGGANFRVTFTLRKIVR